MTRIRKTKQLSHADDSLYLMASNANQQYHIINEFRAVHSACVAQCVSMLVGQCSCDDASEPAVLCGRNVPASVPEAFQIPLVFIKECLWLESEIQMSYIVNYTL